MKQIWRLLLIAVALTVPSLAVGGRAAAQSAPAAVFFSGFETGDLSEWSSNVGIVTATDVVTQGGYSGKVSWSSPGLVISTTGLNLSTAYVRFNFYTTAASTSSRTSIIAGLYGPRGPWAAAAASSVRLTTSTGGALQIGAYATGGGLIGSVYTLSPATWYTIELETAIGSTNGNGTIELQINGASVATSSTANTWIGGVQTNIDQAVIGMPGGTGGSGSLWYDDIILRSDRYPGPGYTIARQGTAGTSTYADWTCSSTAAASWSETPFSATNDCSSTSTSPTAQTMLMAPFNAAGSGQEGSGIIYPAYTINAAKTALIGKISSGASANAMSVLQLVGGSNVEAAFANATSSTYEQGAIWSPTFANLTDGTTQIGAVDNNTVAGVTAQVEDVWEMVDYQPTVTPTATPAATPTPTATPTTVPTSVAGSLLQAQLGAAAQMPAATTWASFNKTQANLPTDSTARFWVDIRSMAYVTAGSTATSCQIGLSARSDLVPGALSAWVTVPANTTIAIPLEWVTTASAGQSLVLSMQLSSAAAAGFTIQPWTSVTAEVIPAE